MPNKQIGCVKITIHVLQNAQRSRHADRGVVERSTPAKKPGTRAHGVSASARNSAIEISPALGSLCLIGEHETALERQSARCRDEDAGKKKTARKLVRDMHERSTAPASKMP